MIINAGRRLRRHPNTDGGSGIADAGFTLVEMVIAVVVVLVLAGAALLAVPGITASGRQAACDAVAESVSNAITASYAHNGDYSRANDLVGDDFLVDEAPASKLTIGTATATGVTVEFGEECTGDRVPAIWAGYAADGAYTFGDGGDSQGGGSQGGGGQTYAVGDAGPAGGTIIYASVGGFASGTGTAHYLEAGVAPLDQGPWGCGSVDVVGATGVGIGDGKSNTEAILNAGCASGSIAEEAQEYALGGYHDWYLPSKSELNQICRWQAGQQSGVGTEDSTCSGPISYDYFWSSSQATDSTAWRQKVPNGGMAFDEGKNMNSPSWPIRAF